MIGTTVKTTEYISILPSSLSDNESSYDNKFKKVFIVLVSIAC